MSVSSRRILGWTLSRQMCGGLKGMCSTKSAWGISISNNLFKSSSRLKSSLAETTPTTEESKKGGTGGTGFEDLDKPIKFTTSKASEWKATDTHGGGATDDTPTYQPFIVTISVGIFLLYFLALREENDVDERMKVPLWERIPGLERQQLEMLLQYNKDHNLPTTDISERLAYIKGQQTDAGNKENTKTTK